MRTATKLIFPKAQQKITILDNNVPKEETFFYPSVNVYPTDKDKEYKVDIFVYIPRNSSKTQVIDDSNLIMGNDHFNLLFINTEDVNISTSKKINCRRFTVEYNVDDKEQNATYTFYKLSFTYEIADASWAEGIVVYNDNNLQTASGLTRPSPTARGTVSAVAEE